MDHDTRDLRARDASHAAFVAWVADYVVDDSATYVCAADDNDVTHVARVACSQRGSELVVTVTIV
jgi:hypothetical protein